MQINIFFQWVGVQIPDRPPVFCSELASERIGHAWYQFALTNLKERFTPRSHRIITCMHHLCFPIHGVIQRTGELHIPPYALGFFNLCIYVYISIILLHNDMRGIIREFLSILLVAHAASRRWLAGPCAITPCNQDHIGKSSFFPSNHGVICIIFLYFQWSLETLGRERHNGPAYHPGADEKQHQSLGLQVCMMGLFNMRSELHQNAALTDLLVYMQWKLIITQWNIDLCSGDTDGRVPVTSSRLSVNQLQLPVAAKWRPWFSSTKVLTCTQLFHSLTCSLQQQATTTKSSKHP